eukprot:scaffold20281_cov48-Phaeocystis_antarctica.AAC.7
MPASGSGGILERLASMSRPGPGPIGPAPIGPAPIGPGPIGPVPIGPAEPIGPELRACAAAMPPAGMPLTATA